MERFYLEPRLYGQYKLNDWLRLKMAFGVQNQFISQVDQIEQSQLGLSNRIWVMAAKDDEIPVVKSRQFNAGFVASIKDWRIEVDGYYKDIENIVNFSNDIALSTGFLRGNATAMGVDFLIKRRWKNVRSWISYSLSEVLYDFTDLSDSKFQAPFNQRHTVKWVNSLSWRQFEFSAAFKIASGKPYSSIADLIFTGSILDDADMDEQFEIIYEGINNEQLPLFHQLDLTVFWNFPKNPDKKWIGKLGLSCYNVYNRDNVLSRTYELEELEDEFGNLTVEPFAIDKYYLGFTPNVLLRFEF